MLSKFLKLFQKQKKRIVATSHDGLEYAFTSGGVSFYKYRDDFSMPADRALSAMDIYEELNQRIDRQYLSSFFDTLTILLNQGKLVDASSLVTIAKSRLDHITNGDLIMKLATVIYIAEWEDPTRYSLVEGEQKIAHWQQHEDVDAFFLRAPIAQYMPSFQSLGTNTRTYLQQQSSEVMRQLKFNLNLLSDSNDSNDLKTSLKLQYERTKAFNKWLQ